MSRTIPDDVVQILGRDAAGCASGTWRYGVLLRSDRPPFRLALGGDLPPYVRDSNVAETGALLYGVRAACWLWLAAEGGIAGWFLRSDNRNALEAVRSGRSRNADIQEVARATRDLLRQAGGKTDLKHVPGHRSDASKATWANNLCDRMASRALPPPTWTSP